MSRLVRSIFKPNFQIYFDMYTRCMCILAGTMNSGDLIHETPCSTTQFSHCQGPEENRTSASVMLACVGMFHTGRFVKGQCHMIDTCGYMSPLGQIDAVARLKEKQASKDAIRSTICQLREEAMRGDKYCLN